MPQAGDIWRRNGTHVLVREVSDAVYHYHEWRGHKINMRTPLALFLRLYER